jgi:hypothetical protein
MAWSLALAAILCIGCLGFMTYGYAADASSNTGEQTEITIFDHEAAVLGDLLVWFGKDNLGWAQIFTYNLVTKQQKQLTATRTYKERLSVGGNAAVYTENGRNIVLVNLQTGVTTNTDIKTSDHKYVRTDGHYVIYDQPLENKIYSYNIETKEVKLIGEGQNPSIVDGVVVYSINDLMLYDARTGESRILWKAVPGGYVDGPPAFNGKNVVWTQFIASEKTNPFHTIMLNVGEKDLVPQVLKTSETEVYVFGKTPINSSYTAWTPTENHIDLGNHSGTYTLGNIVAADLSTHQMGSVTDSNQEIIGMDNNDKLLLADKDHHVWMYTLQTTSQGVTATKTMLTITKTVVTAVPPLVGNKEPSQAVTDSNTTKSIRVFLDGEEITFHQQPVLKDGSTTVEFRPIFEKLGLHVVWDGATQTVIGTKEGLSLKLTLGQTGAVVNGSDVKLLVAPFLNQGYTFVPLRFVGEATGRKVLWDPKLMTVNINSATEGK